MVVYTGQEIFLKEQMSFSKLQLRSWLLKVDNDLTDEKRKTIHTTQLQIIALTDLFPK